MAIPVLFVFQDTALFIARVVLAFAFLGTFKRGDAKSIAQFALRAVVSLLLALGLGVQIAALTICVASVIVLVIGILKRDSAGWRRALLCFALAAVLASSGGGRIALGEW